MTILVTGATGTIGSLVLQGLAQRGASVRALVREPGKAALPAGSTEVVADMSDVASMRQALTGVRSLFLINAVTPAEVTQGLQTLALAREAGIERIVYLSVIHADQFTDVPHFTGKYTVERMIEQLDLPVSVLRPAYFMQNERQVQAVIQGYGVYPMPIGAAGGGDDRHAGHRRCGGGGTAAARCVRPCAAACDDGSGRSVAVHRRIGSQGLE